MDVRAGLLVLLFATAGPGQGETGTDDAERLADEVLAAHQADEDLRIVLSGYAEAWIASEILLARGEDAAVRAVASSLQASSPTIAKQLSLIADRLTTKAARMALATTVAAIHKNEPAEVARVLEKATAALDDAKRGAIFVATALGMVVRADQSQRRHKYDVALAQREAALALYERLGDARNAAFARILICQTHRLAGRFTAAFKAGEDALRAAEAAALERYVLHMLKQLGPLANSLGRFDDAESFLERALKLATKRGDRPSVLSATSNLAYVAQSRGRYREAVALQREVLALARELDDSSGVNHCLYALGQLHWHLGNLVKARSFATEAVALAREHGRDRLAVSGLQTLAIVEQSRGDLLSARQYARDAANVARKTGSAAFLGAAVGTQSSMVAALGDTARALELAKESLRLAEEAGFAVGEADGLNSVGVSYMNLGRFSDGIAWLERAVLRCEQLGYHRGVAQALSNMGAAELTLGAPDRAAAHYRRALTLYGELDESLPAASTRQGLGRALEMVGALDDARREYERCLTDLKRLSAEGDIPLVLWSLGRLSRKRGDLAAAERYQKESLSILRRRKAPAPRALIELARVRAAQGQLKSALQLLQDAELEQQYMETPIELGLEHTRMLAAMGRRREALERAKNTVPLLHASLSGLADATTIAGRERYRDLYTVGADIALDLDDVDELWWFIQQSRAGALLEAFHSRAAIHAARLPRALVEAEVEARGAVTAAAARHRRSLRAGERSVIRTTKQELERARARQAEVAHRVQREAKRIAAVTYPTPASLQSIQATLRSDEAFVSFQLLSKELVAILLTKRGVQVVRLGASEAARKGWDQLPAPKPDRAADESTLRPMLSLPLDKRTRRLLISPTGFLAYIPFVLIYGGVDIAYAPSATTYATLLADRAKRGTQVFAIGNPAYGTNSRLPLGAVLRSDTLVPLPGSEAEAKAIGDRILLGDAASESAFRRAMAEDHRWRAVHLACHGFVDPTRPALSWLALVGGGGHDGSLTSLDVLQMKIDTDLAVLSACDSARGSIYRSEGVVGLARAFMVAGAPRVLVSLWKVDDKATKTLMERFYALWNPGDGAKALPAATALRKAQEFVARQPRWKNPYYWASWQLWGLPE